VDTWNFFGLLEDIEGDELVRAIHGV
jgi:hypothetical protein